MAFPKKTSPEAIRTVAIDLLEKEGETTLTIRRVASKLGLAPNALYGHFPTRDILVAAVADEVAKRLLAAINNALAKLKTQKANPEKQVRTLIEVYIKFARSHPALYQTLMTDMSPAEVHLPKPLGHDEPWLKVVEILTPLTGMANVALAAVTLWSFVHGMLTLERANLLGGKKPSDVSEFGMDALLKGLMPQISATEPKN
jgi:AcrR family transcriptional regulator